MKIEEVNPNLINLKPNYIFINTTQKKIIINICIKTTSSFTIKLKDNNKDFYSDKVHPIWIYKDKLCISKKFILTNTTKFNLEVFDIDKNVLVYYNSFNKSNSIQNNVNIINSKTSLQTKSKLSTREEKHDKPNFYELLTMKVRYTFINIKLLIAIFFNTLKKILIYIFTNTVK